MSTPPAHPSRPGDDARLLRRLKVGLALMVLVFVGQIVAPRGVPELWPLTRWGMFARGRVTLGTSYSQYQIRVIDTSGQIHRLWPTELFAVMGYVDWGPDPIGNPLIEQLLTGDTETRQQSRSSVVGQVARLYPSLTVSDIQIWELTWDVHPTASPAFDLDDPISEVLMTSLDPEINQINQINQINPPFASAEAS